MRPLAVLLGIVMGSTFSIALTLVMIGAVFLLMPEDSARISVERLPLIKAFLVSASLTAVAACSFYGELRARRWRLATHAVLIVLLAGAAWLYWPER
jgi:hypothetical protein